MAGETSGSKGGSPAGPLYMRKIDTTSSVRSGEESAPEEPAMPDVPVGGLARVTSYNKLERNIDQEDLDSSMALQDSHL